MALTVIMILYVVIGVVSAVGSVAIVQKYFSAKAEQIFFGFLLVPIAALYLSFTAYFGADEAWRVETVAAILYAVLGILGMRLPVVLLLGYALHGGWDLLHELHAHAGVQVGDVGTISQIPLAYGAFCAALDWCMAVYFYTRRDRWNAAWRTRAR